jgi:hypothetical protein
MINIDRKGDSDVRKDRVRDISKKERGEKEKDTERKG